MARPGRRKYSGIPTRSTLLLNDPRSGRGDVYQRGNTSNIKARDALDGIVITEGPNQRGGWVTKLKCAMCDIWLNDGQRGYHITINGKRELICGTCFTRPRTALKPLGGMPS